MLERLRLRHGGVVAACAAALVLAGGCSGEATSSSTGPGGALEDQLPVSGIVRIRGKVASSGTVQFRAPKGRPNTATNDKGGRYSLKTSKGDNEVTVATPENAQNPTLASTVLHCDVGYAD